MTGNFVKYLKILMHMDDAQWAETDCSSQLSKQFFKLAL